MAKVTTITANDLKPITKPPKSAMRQRGEVPSNELVPLQFRMTPDFVRAFKQAALDSDMKLNELLKACFDDYQKNNN